MNTEPILKYFNLLMRAVCEYVSVSNTNLGDGGWQRLGRPYNCFYFTLYLLFRIVIRIERLNNFTINCPLLNWVITLL